MGDVQRMVYSCTIEILVVYVLAWRWAGLSPVSAAIFALVTVGITVALQLAIGFADAHFSHVEHAQRREAFRSAVCKCGHRGAEHRIVHRVACDQCGCSAMVEVVRSDGEES